MVHEVQEMGTLRRKLRQNLTWLGGEHRLRNARLLHLAVKAQTLNLDVLGQQTGSCMVDALYQR